jgi:phage tail sheath protein FI
VRQPAHAGEPNTAQFLTSSTATAPLNIQFYGGNSGKNEVNVDVGTLTIAYQTFQSPEDFPDVSLIIQGKARGLGVTSNTQLGNYIVDNIAGKREDMMAFVSFDKPLMVNNQGYEAQSMVSARKNAAYSSFVVYDSGYYYRYDQYNDQYWWVPQNGQIAGLCAQTDLTNAPWWSPAGVTRGKLKNVVRLAYNPKQADRDLLYNNDINPVVTMPGAGTMLYGDKTGLGLASAFSRINVQRLFIVLRKAISRLARQFLFEFNDDFTRARFVATVAPYLKDVQGQRGITDFIVVCDKTNNTPEVIMKNQFVASIGVKPNYSINFVYLNFVAVRTDVSFSVVFGPNGSIG